MPVVYRVFFFLWFLDSYYILARARMVKIHTHLFNNTCAASKSHLINAAGERTSLNCPYNVLETARI